MEAGVSSHSKYVHNIEARKLLEKHWPQPPMPPLVTVPPAPSPCGHTRAKCVYDSDDGEFERWECPDCGERWGVEIPQ